MVSASVSVSVSADLPVSVSVGWHPLGMPAGSVILGCCHLIDGPELAANIGKWRCSLHRVALIMHLADLIWPFALDVGQHSDDFLITENILIDRHVGLVVRHVG